MRTWDIVDKLDPTLQITVQKKNQRPATSGLTSAVRTVLVLSVALAASGSSKSGIRQHGVSASSIPVFSKKGSHSVSSDRTRGALRDADTQRGQSTSKLARAIPAFFQPASDEDEYDDDYSFA